MSESHDTGLLPGDLDPARPRVVETPWGTLALYPLGDGWVAANAWCPHMQGPLHQGTRRGTEVACPWHQWRFDLASGERTDAADPEGAYRIAVHRVVVGAGGRLYVEGPRRAR